MPRIFHHNLENYNGGEAHTIRLRAAYRGIRTSLENQHDHIIVAGFTEVLRARAYRSLGELKEELIGDTGRLVAISVGQTAGGDHPGRVEYVGIAWHPNHVRVEHVGVAVRHSVSRFSYPVTHLQIDQLGDPPVLQIGPEILTIADHRGLAFVTGIYNNRPYLFGFMHNMYTHGSRTTDFTQLASMVASARRMIGGAYSDAEIIIGGDFNVAPRNPTTERGERLVLYERHASNRFGDAVTTGSNPYDFFLVSNPAVLEDRTVHVYGHTRLSDDAGQAPSDHAAVTLDYVIQHPIGRI